MTMYLPNRDVRPTGQEPAEFMDAHRAGEPGDVRPQDAPRRTGTTARLDPQTRLDIARWARQYISHVVENHNGGRDDVRAVIDDLRLETNIFGTDERDTA